ncbi:MAG TPA: hypothetical protein VE800_04040, partial [Actinomycetota bacterium]|nr:hypothetical protein [Actinomycetota bacterium]
MSATPSPSRGRRRWTPGILAPWIWNPRWIPGFVLLQVAAMLAFAERVPGTFEGVPGGIGVLLAVASALVCGPVAGTLVALIGGGLFVGLVADLRAESWIAVVIWVFAAVGTGVIAGRLREADRQRVAAMSRERLAAGRLHRLQAVTGALAGAMTAEEVARVTVGAAM